MDETPRLAALRALVGRVMAGEELPMVRVPFAMQGDPATERIIAMSSYELRAFVATSDGSYAKSRGLFLGTGKIGLALTAGVMAGQAVCNARRKKAAERAMQPRWVRGEGGALAISPLGFYLASPSGIHYWAWGAIDYCSVVADQVIEIVGRSTQGSIRWQLTSELAELIFYLWAIVRAPHHPQLPESLAGPASPPELPH
ncbi:hypothetical protein BSZ39_02595 [Bowdeniella nasicola]|uniref:Uncharacterized protein n=1 Tax=Bowdeniella nasicola TaxID=208480 RepID=A0A1Q5Q4H5_9ACTO|nr:hypothetical protein [Bowdeniella nasicola]OKL54693.1 hypothetical protein BSZ39_02595 [Bowdeniella nasicola]